MIDNLYSVKLFGENQEINRKENTEPKEWYDVRYASADLKVCLSYFGIEILWCPSTNTEKKYIKSEEGSAGKTYHIEGILTAPAIIHAIERALLSHIVLYQCGMPQALTFVEKYAVPEKNQDSDDRIRIMEEWIQDRNHESYSMVQQFWSMDPVTVSLIEGRLNPNHVVAENLQKKAVIEYILNSKKSNTDSVVSAAFYEPSKESKPVDYRLPALYSYLYAKSRTTNLEQFIFFWTTIAALLHIFYQPTDTKSSSQSTDAGGMKALAKAYGLLSDKGEAIRLSVRDGAPGAEVFPCMIRLFGMLLEHTENLYTEDFAYENLQDAICKLRDTYLKMEQEDGETEKKYKNKYKNKYLNDNFTSSEIELYSKIREKLDNLHSSSPSDEALFNEGLLNLIEVTAGYFKEQLYYKKYVQYIDSVKNKKDKNARNRILDKHFKEILNPVLNKLKGDQREKEEKNISNQQWKNSLPHTIITFAEKYVDFANRPDREKKDKAIQRQLYDAWKDGNSDEGGYVIKFEKVLEMYDLFPKEIVDAFHEIDGELQSIDVDLQRKKSEREGINQWKIMDEWVTDLREFNAETNPDSNLSLRRMKRFFLLELPYYLRNKYFHLSRLLPIFDSIDVVIIGDLTMVMESFLDQNLAGVIMDEDK